MINFSEIIYKIALYLPGFLLAITFHEWAHAYSAYRFGDDTAKRIGRMSFNPMVHIDPFGTIIFPLLGIISGWGFIGWAKPVPVNLRNIHPKKINRADFWISFAGPLANLFLAMVSALLFALIIVYFPQNSEYFRHLVAMFQYCIFINMILFFFNLIPLPPLDGSHMLASFMGYEMKRKYLSIGAYVPMIYMGVLVLSMMGVRVFSFILTPAIYLGSFMQSIFLRLVA